MDDFGGVFPGSTEDGFWEAAHHASIELNEDYQPIQVESLANLETVLAKLHDGFAPDVGLLAYSLSVRFFAANNYAEYTRYLAEGAYECQLELQRNRGERIHKGHTLYQLGLVVAALGDPEGAFRWFMLAHLEDCMTEASAEGRKNGMAFQALRTRYGIRSDEFDRLWNAVDTWKAKKDDESVVDRYASKYPEVLYLMTWVDAAVVGPLSRTTTEVPNWTLLRELLAEVKADGGGDGKSAELWLASYFMGVPAFEVRQNVWTSTGEYEFDVLVASGLDHAHLASTLGSYFAGEAKNWGKEVGVGAVNHFASKLMFHDMNIGVLLAKKNVSGAGQVAYRNARKTLLKLGHAQGVHILIWDEDDLDRLVAERIGPLAALRAGYEQARFEFGGRHGG